MKTARLETAKITRAVMISQALFTAGNSLTTGGFFYYFINDFHPSAFLFAVLQVAPETAEAFSGFSRWLMVKTYDRKRMWIWGLILGRSAALCIPIALLFPATSSAQPPILFILLCTVTWYLFQGVGYLSLISWLTDLVPEQNWGEFFASRKMAHLWIMICVPIAAGLLRKRYLYGLSETAAHWSYAIIFIAGGLLCLSSILPLLKFPHVPWRIDSPQLPSTPFSAIKLNRNLRFLLASRWWLAFFQGLSQVVLYQFSLNVLMVSLETYYVFSAIMYGLQIPLSWQAGKLSDKSQDRRGLAIGMVLASFGLLFFLIASPQQQWVLAGTYILWGAFGLVNVCGENLCLKLSPPSDNAAQFSLYRQTSGFIAGAAGLLGGLWLDSLLKEMTNSAMWPYYTIIIAAFVGRLTAPLWILGINSVGPILPVDTTQHSTGETGSQATGSNE